MIGRRRDDETKPWELEAGDYCRRGRGWWVCLPSGVGPSCLTADPPEEGWDVVEHEDGTISVSPSIHDVGTPNGWHGYLERGVWREC